MKESSPASRGESVQPVPQVAYVVKRGPSELERSYDPRADERLDPLASLLRW